MEILPGRCCGATICSRYTRANHDSFGSARRLEDAPPYDGDKYVGPEPGGAERRAIVVDAYDSD